MAGRPHQLDDAAVAKAVAQAFVDGNSRQQMADMFSVSDLNTITRWRRDPRVKAHALKLIEDRVLEITRKVDSTIAARLQNTADLTTKELLEIRKEFLGGALRQQTEKSDEHTISEAMEAIEQNPELVEQMRELLKNKPSETDPAAAVE